MTSRLLLSLVKTLLSFVFFSFALMATATAAPKDEALRIGISPFNTPVGLFRTHRPLREHLESTLNRPVRLLTSTGYEEFLQDAQNGRFDIVITPPHFGAILLRQDFVPLVRYQGTIEFIFAVRSNQEFKTVSALRGKRIAFPNRMAYFSVGGVKLLEEMGMRRDVDYIYIEHSSHASAMTAVTLNMADAAVTGAPPFNQMAPEIRKKLKVLPWGKGLPHLMTIAMKRLGEDEIRRIRRAFERFPDTPGGRKFFTETKYMGYAPVSEEDIKTLQPYINLTLAIMQEQRGEEEEGVAAAP